MYFHQSNILHVSARAFKEMESSQDTNTSTDLFLFVKE